MKQIYINCDVGDAVYLVDRTGIGSIISLTCERVSRGRDGNKYHFDEMVGYFEDKEFGKTLYTKYDEAYDAIEDYRATATIN